MQWALSDQLEGFVSFSFTLLAVSNDDDHGQGDEAVARVVTVEGGRAELPCDTSAPVPGDSIYLVLWYNSLDSSGTPIYRWATRRCVINKISQVEHDVSCPALSQSAIINY